MLRSTRFTQSSATYVAVVHSPITDKGRTFVVDEMVYKTQQWLNATYRGKTGFGSVAETGATGWDTVNGLIRALQIELGITATANNFGPGT